MNQRISSIFAWTTDPPWVFFDREHSTFDYWETIIIWCVEVSCGKTYHS